MPVSIFRRPVAVVLVATAASFATVVACRSTDDPRAGLGIPGGGSTSSSSSGGSSSGGLDATVPEGPVDCGPPPAATAPFSKQALIGAAADCAAYHSCTFLNAATALRSSVRADATAKTDASRTAAQAAWATAMNEWSKMELFQFGPVAPSVIDKYHGRGLRSFVHPWPDTSRCQVETQIVKKGYQQGWDAVLPNGRGLFAIEYALHHPGADTACLPGSETGQAWSALAPDAIATAKAEYAQAVADNVASVALEIHNLWLPTGEDFKAKLLAHDQYGSDQETLNVIAWALIYAEKEVKDFKLAPLAGVQATAPNPETPFAARDIENIRTNLRAFRALFQGCGDAGAGLGFDDWLIAVGQQQLANDILGALAQAEAAADAFPPFAQATTDQFSAFYATVRSLTTLVKTSLMGSASPLNLKLPATAASDTD